jgi:hypothetical protein
MEIKLVRVDTSKFSGYKKFTDFPVYEHNPFWIDVVESKPFNVVIGGNKKKRSALDEEENHAWTYIETDYKAKVYDTQKFVKLFKIAIEDLKNLSSPAGMILWYLVDNLQEGSDTVRFDVRIYQAEMKYKSKSIIYKSLYDLLKQQFIARKSGSDGFLYINVAKVFNGKREKNAMLKDHVKDLIAEKYQNR